MQEFREWLTELAQLKVSSLLAGRLLLGLQASDADGGCTSKMVLTWFLARGVGNFSLQMPV